MLQAVFNDSGNRVVTHASGTRETSRMNIFRVDESIISPPVDVVDVPGGEYGTPAHRCFC